MQCWYFCSMKRKYLWILASVMGSTLIALISLQTLYFKEVIEICTEQFDLQAQRAIRRVARETENELRHLPAFDELTIDERINGGDIDRKLREMLKDNGIEVGYHFRVTTTDGREIYRCSDYMPPVREKEYEQQLFVHSPKAQMGVLKIHFPERGKFILGSVHYMIPVVVLTVMVLIMFVITIWATFLQKRVSEMKNDFINNMTHELKTPISSISLAAQMLSDASMPKSEETLKHLGGVIVDETKRLRFLVEKVLQMSMFDRKDAATFRLVELDVNSLIFDVVSTFRLKVENAGGTIGAELNAEDGVVMADEMHLTNVIFNLLDNAVKYRSTERSLNLKVSTKDDGDNVMIVVEDNGIGLSKNDAKRVFDKFYRVSTGNRHDVKGFGLGLAYVKKVIQTLHGSISAESELGQGTRFVIRLPRETE